MSDRIRCSACGAESCASGASEKAVCDLTAQLEKARETIAGTQQTQIAGLEVQLASWTERESAICPEDVGFEEYIKALKERIDELRKQLAESDTAQSGKLLRIGELGKRLAKKDAAISNFISQRDVVVRKMLCQDLQIADLKAQLERCDKVAQQNADLNTELDRAYIRNDRLKEENIDARARNEMFKAQLNKARCLLKMAQCPNCDGSGAYPDRYVNPEQCRWCNERKAILEMEDKP